jgi:hypothetical protein
MSEVFSGDGLQWITIFIVIFGGYIQDKVRGAWGQIMRDEHKVINSQLLRLEEKIDNMARK